MQRFASVLEDLELLSVLGGGAGQAGFFGVGGGDEDDGAAAGVDHGSGRFANGANLAAGDDKCADDGQAVQLERIFPNIVVDGAAVDEQVIQPQALRQPLEPASPAS